MPVLTFNGVEIAQSMTIARLLAKEYNLAGKDSVEQAKADMIVDCISDLITGMVAVMKESDETRKAEMKKNHETTVVPNALKLFEKLLDANGGKYFVGNDVSFLLFFA